MCVCVLLAMNKELTKESSEEKGRRGGKQMMKHTPQSRRRKWGGEELALPNQTPHHKRAQDDGRLVFIIYMYPLSTAISKAKKTEGDNYFFALFCVFVLDGKGAGAKSDRRKR